MAFSDAERKVLLAVTGVGPKVVQRLEELGLDSLAVLAQQDAQTVAWRVAEMLGSPRWGSAPRAVASVAAAIERAKLGQDV